MAPARVHVPRRPADTVLYQIVRDHYETFRAVAAGWRDGEGLPAFIDDEFRGFLRCGWLAGGFARFRCDACRFERLVAFSCKGRAVCPSCGGRRMTERAAHLVDAVFPSVPVRPWVLTLPPRLRYALAFDHGLCRAVVGVFVRSVLGALRRRAVSELSVAGGRSGGVAIIQRFGSALNVNVHAHALIVDGVYAEDEAGQLRFHGLAPPDEEAMHKVLGTIARRLGRLLARLGLLDDAADGEAHDRWADEMPLLAGLTAASVQGRVVLGPRAGGEVRRCGALLDLEPLPARDRACHACGGGFDLDASVSVASGNRERLERVCRYALRPPIAQDRVELTPGGDVRLRLRHPWRDGTTHVQFHPLELLERLATLTPRPRINLVLYYGVLAAQAAWRARVQSTSAAPGGSIGPSHDVAESRSTSAQAARGPGANRTWAQWMQRSFGLDVLACSRCGGRLRLVALIEDATVIRRILAHRDWPTEVPPPRPARAPPIGRGYSTAGVAGN